MTSEDYFRDPIIGIQQKNYVKIHNNTFTDNGSHNQGVLYIYLMPNIEIHSNNRFLDNTDYYSNLNDKVVSKFKEYGHYIQKDFESMNALNCKSTIFLERCINVALSDLTIESPN